MTKKISCEKGDEVVVIAGTEKGKRGKIIEVMPEKQRVIVEGVKMIKKPHAQEPAKSARRDCRARRNRSHFQRDEGRDV